MINLAERSYLSIGQVVNYLRSSYPDLSNSKIRFLEDEGLITPHRTPKGYRQYSKEDVDRLEVILHLQKTITKKPLVRNVPNVPGLFGENLLRARPMRGKREGSRCAPRALVETLSAGAAGRVGLLITLDRRLIQGGSAADPRWISRRSSEGGPPSHLRGI